MGDDERDSRKSESSDSKFISVFFFFFLPSLHPALTSKLVSKMFEVIKIKDYQSTKLRSAELKNIFPKRECEISVHLVFR